MAVPVRSDDQAEDVASAPALRLVEGFAEEPGIGRAVTIGASAGFLAIGGAVVLGGWQGGMSIGSALGFGLFVGAWGGAGFGAMLGGVTAASRMIDAENSH